MLGDKRFSYEMKNDNSGNVALSYKGNFIMAQSRNLQTGESVLYLIDKSGRLIKKWNFENCYIFARFSENEKYAAILDGISNRTMLFDLDAKRLKWDVKAFNFDIETDYNMIVTDSGNVVIGAVKNYSSMTPENYIIEISKKGQLCKQRKVSKGQNRSLRVLLIDDKGENICVSQANDVEFIKLR